MGEPKEPHWGPAEPLDWQECTRRNDLDEAAALFYREVMKAPHIRGVEVWQLKDGTLVMRLAQAFTHATTSGPPRVEKHQRTAGGVRREVEE